MADNYVRDSVELSPDDGFAWAKRTSGFVPWSIFYDEPTANKAVVNPMAFFQVFGVPHPREIFRTIDEYVSMEITLADAVQFGEEWLLRNGFSYPREVERRKSEWLPIWPPLLRLVEVEPEWRSVDFEEDILKREERRKKEEDDKRIFKACPLCGKGADLAVIDEPRWEYVHGKEYQDKRPCAANELHRSRGTVTMWLQAPDEDVA